MRRALIVSGSNKAMDSIASFLPTCGYTNVSTTAYGNEARQLVDSMEYSLVIINAPLRDELGQELSIFLAESTYAGIILLCKSEIFEEVSDKVVDYGVCVMTRPMDRTMLYQSIRMMEAVRNRMLGLKQENSHLLMKIDEMRLINRAKCTLMQYLNLTEPEAHRYIEKQAMDTRTTRKEVAQHILSIYEL